MKVKLTINYDGTNYCGWQKQNNGNTVQQTIEQALFSLTGEKIKITGSGRTDAGVHASGQVAHFSIEKENIPAEKFAFALNTILPNDIKIQKSEQVEEDFDACRKAKRKTYEYSMYVSLFEQPLKERYSTKIYPLPNIEKMQQVATLFLGEHDFINFCATGSSVKTTVRTIYKINVEIDNEDIKISITGNGFLYNMVRIIAGTLLEVGYDKLTKEEVEMLLKEKNKKNKARTLCAKGLKLKSVEY